VINQQLNAADGTAGRNAAIITGNDPMEMLRLLNSTMNQLIPGFAPPPAAAQPHSHNTTASSSSGEGETSSGESGMDTSSSDEQQTGSGTEDEEQTRQQQQQQQPWPGFGFPLPFGIQQPHSGQPRTGRQQGVMMSVSIGPDGVPRRQFRRFGGGNGSSTAATRGRTRSPGQEGEERPARRPADEEETETEGETQAESSQENLSGLEEMPEFTGILRQLFGADVLGGFGVHFGGGGAGSGAEATGMEGLPGPLMRMFGMVGNPGDYVFGNQGLDDIISRLMEQTAGKNAPPPAEDEEINQLPRCQITAEEKGN
jgi:hypothetical protein